MKFKKIIIVVFIIINHISFSQEKLIVKTETKFEKQTKVLLSNIKNFQGLSSLLSLYGPGRIKNMHEIFKFIPSINPLNPKENLRISSEYKTRYHPIDKKYKKHQGIDIAVELGTTVHAAADGRIKKIVFSNKGYGNYIIIEHAYGFETKYAHLSIIFVLRQGQRVVLGDIIGMVGSTGKSTGNHLHYEVLKNTKNLNPKPFLNLYKKVLILKN